MKMMNMAETIVLLNVIDLPIRPRTPPRIVNEAILPMWNIICGVPFCFCDCPIYMSFHCLLMESSIPPTKAAQLDIPATIPNVKYAPRENPPFRFIYFANCNLSTTMNTVITRRMIRPILSKVFILSLFMVSVPSFI